MDNKKLTIIVPCRNVVSKAFQLSNTFKTQSCHDFKLILIDDCSDDSTKESLELAFAWKKELCAEDLTITSTEKRRYPGGARNFGASLADTQYIWFIDADDTFFDEEVVKLVLKALEDCHDPDCLVVWHRLLDDRIQPNGYRDSNYGLPRISDIGNVPVAPWIKVFKRELYVEMPEGVLCEDTPWWFKQADQFETAAILKRPCINYDRNNKTAITETVSWVGSNPTTLETLALSNVLIKNGMQDKWVSDALRNIALMYDIRNTFKHRYIYDAWRMRFETEYKNMMSCRYVH